ncbi:MAG TPA: FMN-binding glutamate synthase family protein, partial [Asticcacaulis sp.]|nr:FMN-binding glutamate synthase family protein [Asticcacaulis sp.]
MSRFFVFNLTVALTVLCLALAILINPDLAWPLVFLLPLTALGLYDLIQPHHSILRNYPLMGHFRFIFEYIRPEIRQYLIEDERDPLPFSRDQR